MTASEAGHTAEVGNDEPEIRWPRALRQGDRVAVVSPAKAAVSEEELGQGKLHLTAWGLEVVDGLVMQPWEYLAGDDASRREQLQAALDDESVAAVYCVRGGYGSQRISDDLDLATFVARRGAFVGFSDLTEVHTMLNRTGLVSFYGPGLEWKPHNERESENSLHDALFNSGDMTLRRDPTAGAERIELGGAVTAKIIGGNLTMLAASIGTKSAIDGTGSIVFVEDYNEEPWEYDRLLTQLWRSHVLDAAVGFAVGQFPDRRLEHDGEAGRVVLRELEGRDRPAVGFAQVGHGRNELTLPLGALATIDPHEGEITVHRGRR